MQALYLVTALVLVLCWIWRELEEKS